MEPFVAIFGSSFSGTFVEPFVAIFGSSFSGESKLEPSGDHSSSSYSRTARLLSFYHLRAVGLGQHGRTIGASEQVPQRPHCPIQQFGKPSLR
jgi:hypothetical protein